MSTPCMVSSGKDIPTSMMIAVVSVSRTAMFPPISPSPPSGVKRIFTFGSHVYLLPWVHGRIFDTCILFDRRSHCVIDSGYIFLSALCFCFRRFCCYSDLLFGLLHSGLVFYFDYYCLFLIIIWFFIPVDLFILHISVHVFVRVRLSVRVMVRFSVRTVRLVVLSVFAVLTLFIRVVILSVRVWSSFSTLSV